MDKFLTKENVLIAVAVFIFIAQSNYFATKLDLANVKLDMASIEAELKDYSDKGDKEILQEIKGELKTISTQMRKY